MSAVRRPRLLLVDDDDEILHLLTSMLRGRFCDVVGQATDGEKALELAGALRVDRVAIDAGMPVMDGLTATAAIRARHPRVEIIGFSGSVCTQAFLAAGADAVFAKPDIVGLAEHLARPLAVAA